MSIATPKFSYIQNIESQEYHSLESGQWLLILNLANSINISWEKDIAYELPENTMNFAYIPKYCKLKIQTSASTEFNNYSLLLLHPLWLDELLDTNEKRNKNNIEQSDKIKLWGFCPKNIPLEVQSTLKIIGKLSPDNFYQQCLFQAYVMQIVAQTIPLFREGICNNSCRISDRDYQKIRQVENFIRTHINESCALISLAKNFGMNDCSLKRAFKEVYGTSIFNYLHNLRMQKAMSLLQKDLSIGQIADEIGYKNHSNFTAAFKKTYGYSPKKIRQKQHVLTINEPI